MPAINHFGQPIGESLTEWTPRAKPARQAINGQYCRLEPVDPLKHLDALYSAYHRVDNDEDWTYLFAERPADLHSFRLYLQQLSASEDPLQFAVIDLATEQAVGTCAFMRIDGYNGVLELGGINWSPLMKQQRSGTEAIFLMLQHTFDVLGYRRCEWKCDSCNAPSKSAAARYGFSYEGRFRQAIVTKGRNRDTDWFSIIDKEWPTLKQAFNGWLSAVNFDPRGIQRQRLQAFLPD